MFSSRLKPFRIRVLVSMLLLFLTVIPANAGLNDLLGKKELDESERKETIEKIESIQQKLQLLQDKLRVLERRKAQKQAAERAQAGDGVIPATPVQINWQPVDEATTDPGEYGLYTYLLFKGELSDASAIGTLEDFILTIETLPENDIPATLGNRFLVPVEKPQSMVNLGRQPYDFKLNEAYLRRLGLTMNLPDGPILVSARQPLDPFGIGDLPAFTAVSLGRQAPQRAEELARIWHRQETSMNAIDKRPLADLFWDIVNDAGPTQISSHQDHTLVVLPQR